MPGQKERKEILCLIYSIKSTFFSVKKIIDIILNIGKDCVYILHVKDNIYKFGHTSKLDVRLNTHKNELDYKKENTPLTESRARSNEKFTAIIKLLSNTSVLTNWVKTLSLLMINSLIKDVIFTYN